MTFELWVTFESWVTFELWLGGQTKTQTHTQTHTHINTMTRPGLRAGPSETYIYIYIWKLDAQCSKCYSAINKNLFDETVVVIFQLGSRRALWMFRTVFGQRVVVGRLIMPANLWISIYIHFNCTQQLVKVAIETLMASRSLLHPFVGTWELEVVRWRS